MMRECYLNKTKEGFYRPCVDCSDKYQNTLSYTYIYILRFIHSDYKDVFKNYIFAYRRI